MIKKRLSSDAKERILQNSKVEKIEPMDRWAISLVCFKGGGIGVFKTYREESSKAERATYLVDKFIGFDIVPPTVMREIDGKEGSLQWFIEGAETGWEATRKSAQDLYQMCHNQIMKLWIFDYIICNQDRHGANILVRDGKIYAIDHEYSFCDYASFYREFYGTPITDEIKGKIEAFILCDEGKQDLRSLLLDVLSRDKVKGCFNRIEKVGRLLAEFGNIPYREFSH